MIARSKPAVRTADTTESTGQGKTVGKLSVFTFLTVQFYASGPSAPSWPTAQAARPVLSCVPLARTSHAAL
jgi:hypothetical protein